MNENKNETKFVTYEMFEEYHKRLMEYIGMHDDLMLEGETTCPKCGAIITNDKCENCCNKIEEIPVCHGDTGAITKEEAMKRLGL